MSPPVRSGRASANLFFLLLIRNIKAAYHIMRVLHRYATVFRRVLVLAPIFALLSFCVSGTAWGQRQAYISKWMDVGELAHLYSSEGARGIGGSGLVYPYIHGTTGGLDETFDGEHKWIAIRNYQAPEGNQRGQDGQEYPYYIAYIGESVGPQLFVQNFEMVSRFKPPEVTVDGLPSRRLQTNVNQIDNSMNADRKIVNEISTIVGINMRREIKQFSQQFHDNYHITEYTFTNTGNIDGDEEIERPDHTLDGVYFYLDKRRGATKKAASVTARGATWGKFHMHDMVADGDFRAIYSWPGWTGANVDWNEFGAPGINGGGANWPVPTDTSGRLVGYHFVGESTIFAEGSPGSGKDDPSQPSSMTWYDAESSPIFDFYDPTNVQNNRLKFEELITAGRMDPFHAEAVVQLGDGKDYAHTKSDPKLDAVAGFKVAGAYGPYRLEPGESVKIVTVEAVDGLSFDASVKIGRAYKNIWKQGKDDFTDIEYDADGNGQIEADEIMDKNEWVFTGKDSLFQAFRRAEANYESGYNIPKGPQPPSAFRVASDEGKISLEWETYSEANPTGFEIYRGRNQYQGAVEDDYQYDLIYEAGPDERSYADTDVERGVDYYYYIQAVGQENTDDTGRTPTGVPLKSSRYYTQTYAPARLKRAPGATLSEVRIVPNPYNVTADASVRYPGQAERLGFLNLPGQATIKIFTERGDLVRTIVHDDNSGDEFWDLSTSAEQLVAGGIYVAFIRNEETGETITRKFAVVR